MGESDLQSSSMTEELGSLATTAVKSILSSSQQQWC